MRLLNIHGVGDVRLDAYQRPAAGPQDVVVRMKAVGICGSDLSYIKMGGIPNPLATTALGHEGAGEVIEVGAGITGISVGDAVIVNPMMTPSNIGSGGPEGCFTEELLVRDAVLGVSILPIYSSRQGLVFHQPNFVKKGESHYETNPIDLSQTQLG